MALLEEMAWDRVGRGFSPGKSVRKHKLSSYVGRIMETISSVAGTGAFERAAATLVDQFEIQ